MSEIAIENKKVLCPKTGKKRAFLVCQKWDSVNGKSDCPHFQKLVGNLGQAVFGKGAYVMCGFPDA